MQVKWDEAGGGALEVVSGGGGGGAVEVVSGGGGKVEVTNVLGICVLVGGGISDVLAIGIDVVDGTLSPNEVFVATVVTAELALGSDVPSEFAILVDGRDSDPVNEYWAFKEAAIREATSVPSEVPGVKSGQADADAVLVSSVVAVTEHPVSVIVQVVVVMQSLAAAVENGQEVLMAQSVTVCVEHSC